MRLGATEVVVEEFEASLELFARALECYEIPASRIAHELDAVRGEHYGLLRGRAQPNLHLDTLKHLGIHRALELAEVEAGAAAVGENATSLDLRRATGAVQIAVIRDGRPHYQREADFAYRAGDTAVLVGDREALDRSAALFRAPSGPRRPAVDLRVEQRGRVPVGGRVRADGAARRSGQAAGLRNQQGPSAPQRQPARRGVARRVSGVRALPPGRACDRSPRRESCHRLEKDSAERQPGRDEGQHQIQRLAHDVQLDGPGLRPPGRRGRGSSTRSRC